MLAAGAAFTSLSVRAGDYNAQMDRDGPYFGCGLFGLFGLKLLIRLRNPQAPPMRSHV